MPGEPVLARQLSVSRQAVREALIRLEDEGLISRRRGAGTVINSRAVAIRSRFDRRVQFSDLLVEQGRVPRVEVVNSTISALEEPEATRLGRPVSSWVWQLRRRWYGDDEVVVGVVDTIPLHEGQEPPPSGTPPTEVSEAELGEAVEWEMVKPDAVAADEPLSELCAVAVGHPLLALDVLGVARSGRLLYHALEYYVPGIFDFDFVRVVRR